MDNNRQSGIKPIFKVVLGAALVLCPILTIIARVRKYLDGENRP